MVYTNVQLAAIIGTLEKAYARSERTVTYDNRSVTYRSATEQEASIKYFRGLLSVQSRARMKQTHLVSSKGF
jgi:hypothetical protein